MSNDLVRFSVAMPEDLLIEFDQLVARRGLAKNRSEVVRDLVRDALVEEECSTPGSVVMGTLTIIYNHHSNDLQEKLHTIQHDYFAARTSSSRCMTLCSFSPTVVKPASEAKWPRSCAWRRSS